MPSKKSSSAVKRRKVRKKPKKDPELLLLDEKLYEGMVRGRDYATNVPGIPPQERRWGHEQNS